MGPERGDFQAALVAWTTATALSTKTKFRLADFLPRWGGQRRQSQSEQLQILRGLAARQERRLRGNDR